VGLKRLVVLASGRGSNLQAILDACSDGKLPAEVVGVVSDHAQAGALDKARRAGVPAVALEKFGTRAEYDAVLADRVAQLGPDLIVLAGWMRILSMNFLGRFPGQVLNLHPALPGTFPGVRAIERAWTAYQAGEIGETGCMVHWVPDEGVDVGPVIRQQVVPIFPSDDLASLGRRMHATEHALLVEALQQLCTEKVVS
jgi:phosphoribosylglycinamide formyltransferase 1